MYKVLIADDEGIALRSLSYIIENTWKDKCTVRSADTGRTVIEVAEAFRPDVAVMDIQMPGINGIEAIKEIRKFSPQTLFIIVTAYDQFDYAKEAINLGVISYLTKPLDRDRFVEVMNGAFSQIDREKQKRSNELKIWEKMETVVPMIETGFVYSLLLRNSTDEDIEQYRRLLDITEDAGYIILIEGGDEPDQGNGKNGSVDDGDRLENTIGTGIRIQKYYGLFRSFLKDSIPGIVIGQIIMNKIPAFVPHSREKAGYSERIAMIDKLRRVVKQMEDKTGAVFHVGIGNVCTMSDMQESYSTALQSLRVGNDKVSHADDLPVQCEYEDNYPLGLEKKIFENVEKGKEEEAESAAASYFDWLAETYEPQNDSSVRLKTLEFVLNAERISFSDGSLGVYRITDRSDYLDEVQNLDIDALKKWYVARIGRAAGRQGEKTKRRADSLVDAAKKYIDGHYSKDISLDDISRELDISPYYFSRMFKEEAGVTFIEYLTGLRMDKAKDMLKDSDVSVKEVCSAVGYQDPNYFSRIFKRLVGMTPTEYRGEVLEKV
jgi:two-component system response regulator YesN